VSEIIFIALIGLVAFLYASVGHGGASGYLALMVLAGVSQDLMKPSALIINLLISGISFSQYYKRGHFDWNLLWPFILLSIPLSFIGASQHVNPELYKGILAVCLLLAVLRLIWQIDTKKDFEVKKVKPGMAILIGGFIGYISGLIGIGGGIILSPVLLLLKWADMKKTACVSAAFIFLNSAAGLLSAKTGGFVITTQLGYWVMAAVLGGIAGAWFGSSRFKVQQLKYVLITVLLLACVKLIAH
jgi:uncharacterized membrane protein YfcA